jgi:hypothetical protein
LPGSASLAHRETIEASTIPPDLVAADGEPLVPRPSAVFPKRPRNRGCGKRSATATATAMTGPKTAFSAAFSVCARREVGSNAWGPLRPGCFGPTVGTDGRKMTSQEASLLGALLDRHHSPETNGRMAICRRCGSQTNGPDGRQHVPDERRLARANDWLDMQTRIDIQRASFERARDARSRDGSVARTPPAKGGG